MLLKGRFYILAPVVKDRKGEFKALFDNLTSKGYAKVRIDGVYKELHDDFALIKTNKHTIDVIIDKLTLQGQTLQSLKSRLFDSVGQALKLADGYVILSEIKDSSFVIPDYPKEYVDHLFFRKIFLSKDNISLPEVEPRSFLFNSPHGACPSCTGLGKLLKVVPELIFSEGLSIMEGAILPFSSMFERETWYSQKILKLCQENNINIHIPFNDLSVKSKKIIQNNVVHTIEYRYKKLSQNM